MKSFRAISKRRAGNRNIRRKAAVEHRGLSYHVWEFQEDGYGAESNVENVGRMKDYRGNYEEEILSIVKTW